MSSRINIRPPLGDLAPHCHHVIDGHEPMLSPKGLGGSLGIGEHRAEA